MPRDGEPPDAFLYEAGSPVDVDADELSGPLRTWWMLPGAMRVALNN